jgi:hypothetical protein
LAAAAAAGPSRRAQVCRFGGATIHPFGHRFRGRPFVEQVERTSDAPFPPARGVVAMSKFLYLYRGPATPMEDFTPEQSAEQMQAWGEWMGRVGSALVDGGAPFGARSSVADDGTSPVPGDLNGYTIVEADSLDAARALLERHPFLSEGKGRFAIEIFELVPVAM